MSTLTYQNRSWEILSINERSAFSLDNEWLIYWATKLQTYVAIDGLMRIRARENTIDTCLEKVSLLLNNNFLEMN